MKCLSGVIFARLVIVQPATGSYSGAVPYEKITCRGKLDIHTP